MHIIREVCAYFRVEARESFREVSAYFRVTNIHTFLFSEFISSPNYISVTSTCIFLDLISQKLHYTYSCGIQRITC